MGRFLEGVVLLLADRSGAALRIFEELASSTGRAKVLGLCGQTHALAAMGRVQEASKIAQQTVNAARPHGNPMVLAWALYGYGLTYSRTDPTQALQTFTEALSYCSAHGLPIWEASLTREAARLEAFHGDLDQALEMFERTIISTQESGNITNLMLALAHLVEVFDRIDRPEAAASLHGAVNGRNPIATRETVLSRIRNALGTARYDDLVATGEAMQPPAAASYAREQLRSATKDLSYRT